MTHPESEQHDNQEQATGPADEPSGAERADGSASFSLDMLQGFAQGLPGAANIPGLSDIWKAAGLDQHSSQAESPQSGSHDDMTSEHLSHLEELADDMLSLMRRVRELDDGQKQILARLDQLSEQVQNPGRNVAREMDTLRRDLIGERRHSATADAIGELMPLVDRMKVMHAKLDPTQDQRMLAQLEGVLETLDRCLRRLGGVEFVIPSGTPFDPFQMQGDADHDGFQAVVVTTIQPGLMCGQLILKKAVVRLAPADIAPPETTGDEPHE